MAKSSAKETASGIMKSDIMAAKASWQLIKLKPKAETEGRSGSVSAAA